MLFASLFVVIEVLEALAPTVRVAPVLRSLAFFSAVGVLAPTALLKSSALPGDLGVFEAPKEANAPDPRPKALEADVGDATEETAGELRLNGLALPPWDGVSPPLRFWKE